jgi:hypothetical protein
MEQGKPFSASESPLVDFDAVCQKVRAAIDANACPRRIAARRKRRRAVPDRELDGAGRAQRGPRSVRRIFHRQRPPIVAYDLGDSRSAVLLRAVNGGRTLVGAIMVVMDTRGIQQRRPGLGKIDDA